MSWRNSFRFLARQYKRRSSESLGTNERWNGIFDVKNSSSVQSQFQRRYLSSSLNQTGNLCRELTFEGNMLGRAKLPGFVTGIAQGAGPGGIVASRQYGKRSGDGPDLKRGSSVQRWLADKKKQRFGKKQKRKLRNTVDQRGTTGFDTFFQVGFKKMFSGASIPEETPHMKVNPVLKQPPTSQSVTGILEPTSVEEAMVAPLLARSNLLITRDIEWANLMLGFEQENRYAVMDVCFPQSPVGFIREQSNLLARQFLRTRRPFVAYVTDGLGNELFKVRRPFWWINSSIYAEINGEEVGVVHRRWHLWRRIYDLYLGNKQFAVVENPGFWNWTFTLKDIDGKVLAQIDRDWRGFGFEIFTDAGQYVIRFGNADSSICPVTGIEELDVARPLSLSERAVAVALAISLDNDYFSRHGGWGIPLFLVGE
ncbi:altered inheritance rate of mitochondria protein 25 [Solanum pennellii]|uniref:Phospholipid scramblase n=1 Tax=Solanum pennellii TaxID=28526 RepID=A0ABM1G8G8_SOLPN|nr:altered inheritance rate of mitochondria protein 25 [Solanum pennellii]